MGEGGDGWVDSRRSPIAGIVNQTVPTGVEILQTVKCNDSNWESQWQDRARLGRCDNTWGKTGETASWETGPLDISGATE